VDSHPGLSSLAPDHHEGLVVRLNVEVRHRSGVGVVALEEAGARSSLRGALPEGSDGVLADGVVRGQHDEPAHERLRHEQAIEGVAMKIRELRDVEG